MTMTVNTAATCITCVSSSGCFLCVVDSVSTSDNTAASETTADSAVTTLRPVPLVANSMSLLIS